MSHVLQSKDLAPEISFLVSRSSGPGGQNVNKVNTRITLKFDVPGSSLLNADQKQLLLEKWSTRLTKEGVLIISVQESRSQLQNKELVLMKLDDLLCQAFFKKKKRKPTKPSRAAKQKRIDQKKKHGEKKRWRREL